MKDYLRKGNANWGVFSRPQQAQVFGLNLPDSFFDSYKEELLTCHDILEEAGYQSGKITTVTFDRQFLKKIIHSHIEFIKSRE